jgi:hypothetical protein
MRHDMKADHETPYSYGWIHRGGTAQAELPELADRDAEMIEGALAAGDSRGISDAVSLFEAVMDVCSQGLLDGAQDSDDPGAVAALGMPMGVGG